MLESLLAPLFFVVILAILAGWAYVRRTRDDGRRAPGEITREEWDERRRRKTGT